MSDLKSAVVEQFGPMAEAYRTSAVHASGADLQRLVELAAPQPHERALDAGCGAGHTAAALAPRVAQVTALDLSAAMLDAAHHLAAERGLANVTFRQGDVEQIPFADGSFDLAVSRYSAHHWPNPARALAELRRVLAPGGRFVLGDIVGFDAPLVDTHLQAIELLRDASHVRDQSVVQWVAMLEAAGFAVRHVEPFDCRLEFAPWVQRIATPPHKVAMLQLLFAEAPVEVREALRMEPPDPGSQPTAFTLPGALLVAALDGKQDDEQSAGI